MNVEKNYGIIARYARGIIITTIDTHKGHSECLFCRCLISSFARVWHVNEKVNDSVAFVCVRVSTCFGSIRERDRTVGISYFPCCDCVSGTANRSQRAIVWMETPWRSRRWNDSCQHSGAVCACVFVCMWVYSGLCEHPSSESFCRSALNFTEFHFQFESKRSNMYETHSNMERLTAYSETTMYTCHTEGNCYTWCLRLRVSCNDLNYDMNIIQSSL